MNNKQSSVEFIINNLHLKDSLKWAEIIAEAKAIHKEETIDFAFSWSHERAGRIDVEKDYNETYGGNNEQQ